MARKDHMDAIGAVALTAFALHLAFNQVVIKVTNDGFGPVFQAGLRSFGAVLVLWLWMRARSIPVGLPPNAVWGGVVAGILFGLEFICLYTALDLTTVSRASIIFYSMPVWLALAAHFVLPGERLTGVRSVGLVLAMCGVALAVSNRGGGSASLAGDLLALIAAMCWAGIVLCVRITPLSTARPEQQLFWQVLISAPMLLLAAPFFGDLIRDVQPIHIWGLGFQILLIASFGFLFWFWLMTIYPASSVASFSFLSPVFSVMLGWLLLREEVDVTVWAALALVAVGILLINRPARRAQPA